jgi:hypothetical protein
MPSHGKSAETSYKSPIPIPPCPIACYNKNNAVNTDGYEIFKVLS